VLVLLEEEAELLHARRRLSGRVDRRAIGLRHCARARGFAEAGAGIFEDVDGLSDAIGADVYRRALPLEVVTC
jgi:hypothetical protein